MHLLANCWHELKGAGETAMQARKLDRAEDVSWNPPVLSFTIERHGATVLGSSRAELHRWSVNMHQRTARCERGRYSQLLPTAPRPDVKATAARSGRRGSRSSRSCLQCLQCLSVCIGGLFPRSCCTICSPSLPYIHYKHFYIYVIIYLELLDNPVYDCAVNSLHTFV